MTAIEKPVIQSIKSILDGLDSIRTVVPYPLAEGEVADEISSYPAVVFYPVSYESSFSDTASNAEVRTFAVVLMVDAKNTGGGDGQITKETLFTDALPSFIDDVIGAFAENWDGGNIDGHRVWYSFDTGTRGIETGEQGLIAWADLTLTVQLSVNT